MRQEITQRIYLNKDDIKKLKQEGLTIAAPNGNSFEFIWDGMKPYSRAKKIEGSPSGVGSFASHKNIVIKYIREHGPVHARDIAAALGVTGKRIHNTTYTYRNLITKTPQGLVLASTNGHSKKEVVKNGK